MRCTPTHRAQRFSIPLSLSLDPMGFKPPAARWLTPLQRTVIQDLNSTPLHVPLFPERRGAAGRGASGAGRPSLHSNAQSGRSCVTYGGSHHEELKV